MLPPAQEPGAQPSTTTKKATPPPHQTPRRQNLHGGADEEQQNKERALLPAGEGLGRFRRRLFLRSLPLLLLLVLPEPRRGRRCRCRCCSVGQAAKGGAGRAIAGRQERGLQRGLGLSCFQGVEVQQRRLALARCFGCGGPAVVCVMEVVG